MAAPRGRRRRRLGAHRPPPFVTSVSSRRRRSLAATALRPEVAVGSRSSSRSLDVDHRRRPSARSAGVVEATGAASSRCSETGAGQAFARPLESVVASILAMRAVAMRTARRL
jgi:hypothetical protein